MADPVTLIERPGSMPPLVRRAKPRARRIVVLDNQVIEAA